MIQGTRSGLHFGVQLCSAIVVILALSVIPIAFGLEENGVLETPFTENPPSIDGKWTTVDEWADANVIYMQEKGHEVYVLVKHDRDFIYFIFDAISDQTRWQESKSRMQQHHVAYLLFDTNNDGGNFRLNDDLLITRGEILDENGKPLDFKNASVENTSFGDPNSEDKVGQQVNEPRQFKYAKGFSSRNSPYEPGRDHYIHEFRIPISFLHKSDVYGFSAAYHLGTFADKDNTIFIDWPQDSSIFIPGTYGNLVAVGNTITAPPVPVISISTKSLDFGNVIVSEKSGSKTVTISNVGTGDLKVSNIRTSGQFSFSGITTPLLLEPDEKKTFEVIFAPLSIGEKSGSISITSTDLSKSTLTITASGEGIEEPEFGGGCLIATATYGSELAPQVQMLREIRDNVVLSTDSGINFMSAFNQFYYSFSPTIADWERENLAFKETVKIVITPLLTSLSILNYVDIDSEEEMLGYGIGIIMLNVGMYFGIPAFAILRIKKL